VTKLNLDQLTDLYSLLSVEGIGPGRIRNLLSKFKSTDKILSANYNLLIEVEGISANLANRIQKINHQRLKIKDGVEGELEQLGKLKGRIITVWDEEFPSLLKKIFDPPLMLQFAADLVRQNITTVSGMARGIDSITHSASLKNGGRTIAVIGSGLDVIYPPENNKLFEQITENGAVISEFPLGTKPDAPNFPKRNRIISGLSLGCIIIETGIAGGALQTASFALDQNREVFALPGNVGIKQSDGTNLLIQKGEAELVRSAEDVLIELELKLKPVLGKNIPKQQVDLNLFEEKLLNILDSEALQIDKIAADAKLSTSDCLVHLLSLEFKGMIKQLPGKMFALL